MYIGGWGEWDQPGNRFRFRFVRACARSGCKVGIRTNPDRSPFPFPFSPSGLSLFPFLPAVLTYSYEIRFFTKRVQNRDWELVRPSIGAKFRCASFSCWEKPRIYLKCHPIYWLGWLIGWFLFVWFHFEFVCWFAIFDLCFFLFVYFRFLIFIYYSYSPQSSYPASAGCMDIYTSILERLYLLYVLSMHGIVMEEDLQPRLPVSPWQIHMGYPMGYSMGYHTHTHTHTYCP